MTTMEDIISLLEDFEKWLEQMAEKYNCGQAQIQDLIKQILQG